MPNKIPGCKSPFAGLPKPAKERETATFYAGKRWRELRALFLARNPLCNRCKAKGLIVAANTVHHVLERLLAPARAYDWGNLESLCPACHNQHHKSKQ